MTRENAASKAARYLGEGRLIVERITPGRGLEAICRGDGTVYRLGWNPSGWWCECPARSDQCAHLRAARLVTAPDLTPNNPTHRKQHS